jgi:DNA-binding protein HU-beta
MNKAKLIEQIAHSADLSKASAKEALEGFIESVSDALKNNDSVVLTGFGTFSVSERKSRMGVNPATGKKMEIKSKKVAKFKPGKALRDSIGE